MRLEDVRTFTCPDFYIRSVDAFSMSLRLEDVHTLNLSALTECKVHSSWWFCVIFVQRNLLKQVLLNEKLVQVSLKAWFTLDGSGRIALFGC